MIPSYSNIKLSTLNNNEILVVTIARKLFKNAIDTSTAHELNAAFNYFNSTPTLKIAILTGEGDTFCAGADLKEVSQAKTDFKTLTHMMTRLNEYGMGPLGPTHSISLKPVIAAVCNYAVAGGLELALWCDMVVSHNDAKFGVFCRRFSVPLIDGGSIRLARVIGFSRAMDLILTGRAINGVEAFSWGLVNRLVGKAEDVFGEAEKLAVELCGLPQQCMRSDRISLIESSYGNLERDLRNESRLGANSLIVGLEEAGKFSKNKEGRHGNVVGVSKIKKNLVRMSKL